MYLRLAVSSKQKPDLKYYKCACQHDGLCKLQVTSDTKKDCIGKYIMGVERGERRTHMKLCEQILHLHHNNRYSSSCLFFTVILHISLHIRINCSYRYHLTGAMSAQVFTSIKKWRILLSMDVVTSSTPRCAVLLSYSHCCLNIDNLVWYLLLLCR
jgi:hypothetical protein